MAITYNNNPHTTADWLEEVVYTLEDQGMDSYNLSHLIQPLWVRTYDILHEGLVAKEDAFLSYIRSLDQWFDVHHQTPNYPGSELSKIVSTPVYNLFFNTVTKEFTTKPIPFETVLLYEEREYLHASDDNPLSPTKVRLLQYTAQPTDEARQALLDEVVQHLIDQTSKTLRDRTLEELNVGNEYETYLTLERGETLAADLIKKEGWFYLSRYLSARMTQFRHHRGSEVEAKTIIEEIIRESHGELIDFHFMIEIMEDSEDFSAYTDWGMKEFVKHWGSDPILTALFYTEETGVRELTGYQLHPTQAVIPYLPDTDFEELFTKYVQTVSLPAVDFAIGSQSREFYHTMLELLLEDPRAKKIVDRWGGLYTNFQSDHITQLVYLKNISPEFIAQGNTYYIEHLLKNESTRLFVDQDVFHKAQIEWMGSNMWPEFSSVLRQLATRIEPVTELYQLIDKTGLSLEDFSRDSRQATSQPLIFSPQFKTGEAVYLVDPVIYREDI